MLELNEKLIRKGKPIGLPYVGSKKKISKKIVEIIKQNFGTDKTVYDVFGGGGAITAELMINGIDVVYNDLDKTITDMFERVVIQDRNYLKTLIVDRQTFFRIKNNPYKTVSDNLKLLVNSFGNDRKKYLYKKDISYVKYELAHRIIYNYDTFDGYRKTQLFKDRRFETSQLEQITRLAQLERLQQLPKLPKLMNQDYRYFSNVKNNILYLDPPYENSDTSKYKSSINYQEFYDWAVQMSKNNIVLLSSYEVSDDRFECVYEFKNDRSTMSGGMAGKRTEKLFMVKC